MFARALSQNTVDRQNYILGAVNDCRGCRACRCVCEIMSKCVCVIGVSNELRPEFHRSGCEYAYLQLLDSNGNVGTFRSGFRRVRQAAEDVYLRRPRCLELKWRGCKRKGVRGRRVFRIRFVWDKRMERGDGRLWWIFRMISDTWRNFSSKLPTTYVGQSGQETRPSSSLLMTRRGRHLVDFDRLWLQNLIIQSFH